MDKFEEALRQKYEEYKREESYLERVAGDTTIFRYPHLLELANNFEYDSKTKTFILKNNIEDTILKIGSNEITVYELMCEYSKKLHLYDFFGYKATYEEKYQAFLEVLKTYQNNQGLKWSNETEIDKINIVDLKIRDSFEHLKTFINNSQNTDVYVCKYKNVNHQFQFGSTLKGTNIIFADENKATMCQELFHIIFHLEEGIPGFNNDNMNILETWANADALYLKQLLEGRLTRRARKNTSPHDIKFLDYVYLRAYIGQAFLEENERPYFHTAFSLIEPTIKLLVDSFMTSDEKEINKLLIDGICRDKTDIIKFYFNKKYGNNAYEEVFYNFNLFDRINSIKNICLRNNISFDETLDKMFSSKKMLPTIIDNEVVKFIWSNPQINQDKELIIDLIEDYSELARKINTTITMNEWLIRINEKFGERKYNEVKSLYKGENKMKVFICYPPVSKEYDKIRDAGVAPHLSLLCLGTHIKNTLENVEVILCDGHHDSFMDICTKIRKENPDVIGFSVDFTNYNTSVELANFAKKCNPNVKIGCGSNHASNMYNQILTNQPSYDFVGINDGEEQFESYIRHLRGELPIEEVPNLAYRKDSKVVVNPIRTFDLKKMYPVEYELMDMDKYFKIQKEVFGEDFKMLQFTSQRGCANHPLCVFCGRYDDGMRFRDPIEYAKEVAHYTEKYDLTEVWDRSDSFIQNVKWLKEFADELNKLTDRFKTGKTTFKTYSRADQLLRQDVIDVLKSLHFRMVFIGYEAGDNRILQNIGKHSNIEVYLEATKNVLENDIAIDASFIVGLPGENKESLNNHINFVKKLSEMGLDKIRVNRLLVLPGTPLYREIIKKFPYIASKDIIPMTDLQKMIFQTDLYDLSDFDNNVDNFIDELNKTAHQMSDIIINKGGAIEGYGHGKGANILDGKEIDENDRIKVKQ